MISSVISPTHPASVARNETSTISSRLNQNRFASSDGAPWIATSGTNARASANTSGKRQKKM
jgi:hypothetical protein